MSSLRRFTPPVGLLAIIMVSSACGGANDTIGSENMVPKLLAGEKLADSESLSDQIDKVNREFEAAEVEVRDCLNELGFDYIQRTLSIDFARPDQSLYTISEQMDLYGYGIVENEGSAGVSVVINDPNDSNIEERSSEAANCLEHKYQGNIQYEIVSFFRQNDEISDDILSEQDVQDAMQEWRDCMASNGFHYFSSEDAFISLNKEYESENAKDNFDIEAFKRREIQVAAADVDCHVRYVTPVLRKFIEA